VDARRNNVKNIIIKTHKMDVTKNKNVETTVKYAVDNMDKYVKYVMIYKEPEGPEL